jgi:hypothetical protein
MFFPSLFITDLFLQILRNFFYDDIGICPNPNQYMRIKSVKVLKAKVC